MHNQHRQRLAQLPACQLFKSPLRYPDDQPEYQAAGYASVAIFDTRKLVGIRCKPVNF